VNLLTYQRVYLELSFVCLSDKFFVGERFNESIL